MRVEAPRQRKVKAKEPAETTQDRQRACPVVLRSTLLASHLHHVAKRPRNLKELPDGVFRPRQAKKQKILGPAEATAKTPLAKPKVGDEEESSEYSYYTAPGSWPASLRRRFKPRSR